MISKSNLRSIIKAVLVTDSDLDAYCSDYAPEVFARFSNSMDRVAKMTLLMQLHKQDEILKWLYDFDRERFLSIAKEHPSLRANMGEVSTNDTSSNVSKSENSIIQDNALARSQSPLRRMVLVSFVSQDEHWRRRVRTHLAFLKDGIWDHGDVKPGSSYAAERRRMLEHALIAIVIVSSDYLANESIVASELQYILSCREITVLPLIVRSCLLPDSLATIEPVHRKSPLASLTKAEQDEVLARLAESVRMLALAGEKNNNSIDRSLLETMQNLDSLIYVFQIRARRIIKEAAQDAHFCSRFKELHEEHVSLLKGGKLIEAHEILTSIYELFKRTSFSGVGGGGIVYAPDRKDDSSVLPGNFIYDTMNLIVSGLSKLQEPRKRLEIYCAIDKSDTEWTAPSVSASCIDIVKFYTKVAKLSLRVSKIDQRVQGRSWDYEKDVAGKAAESFTAYSPRSVYIEGALIKHPKFGTGIVANVGEVSVEVLFREGTKRLVHKK